MISIGTPHAATIKLLNARVDLSPRSNTSSILTMSTITSTHMYVCTQSLIPGGILTVHLYASKSFAAITTAPRKVLDVERIGLEDPPTVLRISMDVDL